jgi:hypothetical protein
MLNAKKYIFKSKDTDFKIMALSLAQKKKQIFLCSSNHPNSPEKKSLS